MLWSARVAFASMVAVVVASAWLRLGAPRAACADWPGCRLALGPMPGRAPAASSETAGSAMSAPPLLAGLRLVHRSAASLLLPAVVVLAAIAWRARRRGLVARAAGMCALALGLAALGIVTPGSRSPAVMLGNLLGGLALLALAWSALLSLHADRALPRGVARWAIACAALWALQAAFGAMSGTPPDLRPRGWAPLSHLTLALPALMVGGAVGLATVRRGRRREGWALVLVVLAQALLGLLAAGAAARPELVLVHNACAAGAIALLVGIGSVNSG